MDDDMVVGYWKAKYEKLNTIRERGKFLLIDTGYTIHELIVEADEKYEWLVREVNKNDL